MRARTTICRSLLAKRTCEGRRRRGGKAGRGVWRGWMMCGVVSVGWGVVGGWKGGAWRVGPRVAKHNAEGRQGGSPIKAAAVEGVGQAPEAARHR